MPAGMTNRKPVTIAIACGVLYGLLIRFALNGPQHTGPRSGLYPNVFWVMTAGFLLVMPFVVGWICVAAAPSDGQSHWGRWITAPWLAILLGDLLVLVAGIEGFICILFALPITFVCSSLGGIAAGLTQRARYRTTTTLCLAILPLVLSAVEMQFNGPLEVRTVQTSILIHAPAATVWNNIERVPPIEPAELRPTWAHFVGFPRPVEATLNHEGVGAIRHASFEHGLLFIETITDWQPDQRIRFTIAADTAHIPPTTLDEHVTIGGRFFDVLDGEYRLEPLPNGDILLHLSSQERLSTDFNRYAALWSDAVMTNLQTSILEVVKHRCEQQNIVHAPPVSTGSSNRWPGYQGARD